MGLAVMDDLTGCRLAAVSRVAGCSAAAADAGAGAPFCRLDDAKRVGAADTDLPPRVLAIVDAALLLVAAIDEDAVRAGGLTGRRLGELLLEGSAGAAAAAVASLWEAMEDVLREERAR